VRSGKPYFVACWVPGETLHARPARGQGGLVSRAVDHRETAAVVAELRLIQESDRVSLRRDPHGADPTRCLVEDFPDRVFQPVPPVGSPNHRHILAVRSPIRRADVLEKVARRASGDWRARERPPRGPAVGPPEIVDDQHLAGPGDGAELGALRIQVEAYRAGAVQSLREELAGISVKVCAVSNSLTVRCEARDRDEAAAERQPCE